MSAPSIQYQKRSKFSLVAYPADDHPTSKRPRPSDSVAPMTSAPQAGPSSVFTPRPLLEGANKYVRASHSVAGVRQPQAEPPKLGATGGHSLGVPAVPASGPIRTNVHTKTSTAPAYVYKWPNQLLLAKPSPASQATTAPQQQPMMVGAAAEAVGPGPKASQAVRGSASGSAQHAKAAIQQPMPTASMPVRFGCTPANQQVGKPATQQQQQGQGYKRPAEQGRSPQVSTTPARAVPQPVHQQNTRQIRPMVACSSSGQGSSSSAVLAATRTHAPQVIPGPKPGMVRSGPAAWPQQQQQQQQQQQKSTLPVVAGVGPSRTGRRPQAGTGNPGVQLFSCKAQGAHGKTIIYRRQRNKLQRAGLKPLKPSAKPGLGMTPQAGAAAAAGPGAPAEQHPLRPGGTARLALVTLHTQSQKGHQLAGPVTKCTLRGSCVNSVRLLSQISRRKLVRQGSQVYVVGSRSMVLGGRPASGAAASHARGPVQRNQTSGAGSSASASAAAAAAAAVQPAPPVRRVVARPARQALATSAVQRCLRAVRARNLATRATKQRGMCLHYCRQGRCELAQAGRCEKVHDPSQVAVCPGWLAGKCRDDNCKLQHKVVRSLMPVCTYFLEGVCSNRDCPYLHVSVRSDAPVCKAFLSGYCPRGAACHHKHLTARMAKQLKAEEKKVPVRRVYRRGDPSEAEKAAAAKASAEANTAPSLDLDALLPGALS